MTISLSQQSGTTEKSTEFWKRRSDGVLYEVRPLKPGHTGRLITQQDPEYRKSLVRVRKAPSGVWQTWHIRVLEREFVFVPKTPSQKKKAAR